MSLFQQSHLELLSYLERLSLAFFPPGSGSSYLLLTDKSFYLTSQLNEQTKVIETD